MPIFDTLSLGERFSLFAQARFASTPEGYSPVYVANRPFDRETEITYAVNSFKTTSDTILKRKYALSKHLILVKIFMNNRCFKV